MNTSSSPQRRTDPDPKKTTIYLEASDRQAIAAIRAHYGLRRDTEAIRLALRLWLHAGDTPSRAAERVTEGA